MTDVFVLCGLWDCEGEAVLGVYTSADEARAAGEAIRPGQFDHICVHQVQLGAAPCLQLDPLFYVGE